MWEALIAQSINVSFELLRAHLNKPEGWKPTQQDLDDLNAAVDAATPENEKVEARKRLGLVVAGEEAGK